MDLSAAEQARPVAQRATTSSLFPTLALSGLISTILLIMIGAFVRVTGNGLGCPDWPLCYGQAVPPLKISAWVEFFHRLFGGLVILQVAALVLLAWRRFRRDPWIFRPAVAISVVMAVQVLLGGIHVIYELPRWTGWIHTGVAMIAAGLLAVWVSVTQASLGELGERTAGMLRGSRLVLWTSLAAAATYLLLLSGSLVTRTGASLVCPDFPYCGLAVVPESLRTVVTIQMVHRFSAFVVAFSITLVLWRLLRASRHDPGLRRFALALLALLSLQFGLGMVNVWFAIPMWSRILHLGTGGTIWVVLVLLWVTLRRGQLAGAA